MRERKLNLELWPLYRVMAAQLGKLDPQKTHYFVDKLWRRLPEFLEAHDCSYERLDWGLPQTAPLSNLLPRLMDEYGEEDFGGGVNVALHYTVRFRWQDEELFALYSEPELGVEGGRALVYGPSEVIARLAQELSLWRLTEERIHIYGGGHWIEVRGKRATPVTFEGLYLEDALKQELLQAVRLVFEEDLLARLGLPRRRGLLFVGPPGNGKTLFIRALIHHYSDISVFYLVRNERGAWSHSFDSLMEEAAELLACGGRCLIVLEDIETFMSDPAEKSALLNAMDGVFSHITPDGALLIVATTNHPELLDSALLQRPSRFDRIFVFRSPNERLRRRYLQDKSKLEPAETELAELVEQTQGMSFAFLQELIVSAHYEAAFAGESLAFRHYREATRRLVQQLRQGEQLQTRPTGLDSRRPVGFFTEDDSDEAS